jgi:prevent-host-death family protein
MKVINIQAAKTHLSRLVEEAASGEEIVLAKAGRPYVKLVACMPSKSPRKLGGWEGKLTIGEDFDEVDAEIVRLFGGETKQAGKKVHSKPVRR